MRGAFVMGLGYWLLEDIKRDPETGQLLTKNTWVSFVRVFPHLDVAFFFSFRDIILLAPRIFQLTSE